MARREPRRLEIVVEAHRAATEVDVWLKGDFGMVLLGQGPTQEAALMRARLALAESLLSLRDLCGEHD